MKRDLIYSINKSYSLKNFLSVKLLFFFAIVSISVANGQAQTKGGKVVNSTVQKPVTGDTYAIIFGISNYPGLTPLKYADKDAELFRDFLETPAGGNTKPENIFYRTNENAKAADFNAAAWGWLFKTKALKAGDRLFIYFSGHGDAMTAENYFLLPYDCTPNKDDNNYLGTGHIDMHTVKTLFIKPLVVKGVEALLIVDACRSNDLPGGHEGQQNFVQSIAEEKEGEIIMLSTGAGQSSIESPKVGDGHGLFTWYLVAGLSGDADKEGDAADHDGKVSLAEITSYVKNRVRKEAKNEYNTDQVPVFLPPDRDLETIVNVDSGTYANWKLAQNMRQQTNGKVNRVAVVNSKLGKKAVTSNSLADTVLIALDNRFIAAVKARKLLGENSAEAFYNKMKEKWPGQPMTEDAKYTLAAEFINFGQDKINLFLSGKGIVHVQRMENELNSTKSGASNKNLPIEIAEQLDRMKTLTETGFDKAADMMDKAVRLLQGDPELLGALYPKLYFLKAASYDKVNNFSGKRQGIALLRKAIKKDSIAAYNYLMLGHLLYDLKNDSCELYFKKAMRLAPKWAEPENDLANYYSSKKNYKLAIVHYSVAVKLDSLDALAYQNIGVLYTNENMLDSAREYFLKALVINPCDHYANCNMGTVHAGYMADNSVTNPDFKVSEKYFKKSLTCDPGFTRPYILLARLFDKVNLTDSTFYYLNKGISINPNDASLYRYLGDEYFEQKDTLKSEITYLKGLQVDSLDINNYTSLIWLYENAALNNGRILNGQQNKFAKAILYCQSALKVDPSCSYAYYSLGNIDVDLKLNDKAIPNYEQAIKIDSTYVDAFNGLGNAYYYRGDYDKALLSYKKTVDLNAKFVLGYSSIGDTYYIQKDYNNAQISYQKVIDIDSTYIYAYQRLGGIYTLLREYPKAAANYQKALKLDPANAITYQELGAAYYNLKSYDTAIFYHKKAIQLSPLNAYNYINLAVVYANLNKNDEAILYYKKSIGLDSTIALPYSLMGTVYYKIKAYDNAFLNYQKAIHLDPGNTSAYIGLGNVYYYQKMYDKAILNYQKAIQLDSTYISPYFSLGLIYSDQKAYNKAILCYQKALSLSPRNAFFYNSLGNVYKEIKDYKNQIYNYKKALDIDSTQAYNLADLGFAYIRSGSLPEGIASLQKVAKLYPNDPASYYNLACAYALANDPEKGMAYLKEALEKGFRDYEGLRGDADLENLKKQPGYDALLKQYFADKTK